MSGYFRKSLKELGVVAKNSYLLPFVFFPISDKKLSEHREVVEFFKSDNDVPNPVGTQYVHEDRWFYANGVVSDRNGWAVQAKLLSEILEKKIEALFNPTASVVVDIIETIKGRTFNREESSVKEHIKSLLPAIQSGKPVHIVAYSQGGVTISNTIKKLIKMGVDLSNVSVYTFASPHDEFNFDGKVFSEHFANRGDYVAAIGVLHYRAGKAPVYVADKLGHLLNAHYLYNFINKDYCGGASKLYSFVKKK